MQGDTSILVVSTKPPRRTRRSRTFIAVHLVRRNVCLQVRLSPPVLCGRRRHELQLHSGPRPARSECTDTFEWFLWQYEAATGGRKPKVTVPRRMAFMGDYRS